MGYRSFSEMLVKKRCNGMLPLDVYRSIYTAAKAAPSPFFVEVGTAHGAGTVSLAMGLRDSGRVGKVYSFEKILGGSREAYGDFNQNVGIIKGNIEAFDLVDSIELVFGDVADRVKDVPELEIGLLFLDADGAIDRDFGLFFDRLCEGAPIIIDDVRDQTRTKSIGQRGLGLGIKIDQKHRLTYRLLELFRTYELVDHGEIVGSDTWIGAKGKGRWSDVPESEILSVYRSLTFTEASVSLLPMRSKVAPMLQRILPRTVVERLKSLENGR